MLVFFIMKTLLPIELIKLLEPVSLEIKVKINTWIEKKTIQPNISSTVSSGSFQKFTIVNSLQDEEIDTFISFIEKRTEENTLQSVINLVDEWMSDESGYDDETYPQIESALKENNLSI